MEISGKVALVTGSSRGIGREVARELAAKAARAAVHYRANRQAAQETLVSLEGGPHPVFAADLSDADSARDLVEGVARNAGFASYCNPYCLTRNEQVGGSSPLLGFDLPQQTIHIVDRLLRCRDS